MIFTTIKAGRLPRVGERIRVLQKGKWVFIGRVRSIEKVNAGWAVVVR